MKTAQEHYTALMADIFDGCDNPTYSLSAICLVNRYGLEAVNAMEDAGLIKYIGQNSNNLAVYKIR